MAQLIKLRDYISRYEVNPYHYPTQFIRLKRENWEKLLLLWEKENEAQRKAEMEEKLRREQEKERFRWQNLFQRNTKAEDPVIFKRNLPKSKDNLRKYFLNRLFPFQLKWATSTLTQVSFTDKKYYFDEQLKFLLQHFPDIYLIMYYPIVNVKKAPVDMDIIMISPVEMEIISIIKEEPNAIVIVDDERTWTVNYNNDTSKKIISPIISLKRTEQIVRSILKKHDLSYTIKKTVLSEDAHLVYAQEPYNVSLVGASDFKRWYERKRDLTGSLKGMQLKVAEALLEHCLTTSVRRPEWENEDDNELTLLVEDK